MIHAPILMAGMAIAGTALISIAPAAVAATTKINYAKQYEAIVAPAKKALTVFDAHQTAKNERAVASSLTATGAKLLRAKWPAADRADVHALAVSVDDVASDVTLLLKDPAAGISKLTQDAATFNADANVLRADLGLPPSKS